LTTEQRSIWVWAWLSGHGPALCKYTGLHPDWNKEVRISSGKGNIFEGKRQAQDGSGKMVLGPGEIPNFQHTQTSTEEHILYNATCISTEDPNTETKCLKFIFTDSRNK
jgi:hypothetical protein